MEIAVWIVTWVLAAGFVVGGALRVVLPPDQLARFGWGWAAEIPTLVKVVGAFEVAGGLGLVLPALTGILPILTPIAACCLALVMVLAIGFQVRRGGWKDLPVNVVFAVACVFVAVARFSGV
jgi:uncharacterized membrane protein